MACGVEMMSQCRSPPAGFGPGTPRPADWSLAMPDQYTAADRIARARGFSRRDLDAYGLSSQQRARQAWDDHRFDRQIVPVTVPSDDGSPPRLVERDEGLRDTSMEALAALPSVKVDGLHTAGTSSQISDGASAAVLMSQQAARRLGLTPMARLLAQCVIGGDTELMLDGPVDAAAKLFARTRMTVADVDLFEVNGHSPRSPCRSRTCMA